MCHRQHTAIVILVVAGELAFDLVAWSAVAASVRTTALDHEVRDHAMKGKSIVKVMFSEVDKVLHSIRCVFLKEFDLHHTFFGMYLGNLHFGFLNSGTKVSKLPCQHDIVMQNR